MKVFWNIERAFQISWKKKAAIPKGGLNDYRIPKAWGGRTVWNSEGKGGLSILEFPKARGGLDEDAARGRVGIFSGITQLFILRIILQRVFPLPVSALITVFFPSKTGPRT